MPLQQSSKNVLTMLNDFLKEISNSDYNMSHALLMNSSIGQHTRHIIEFFLTITKDDGNGSMSYDKRKRDIRIETSPEFASGVLNEMITNLKNLEQDKKMILISQPDSNQADEVQLKTSLYRELFYCLEHAIHHMAIIRIAVETLFPKYNLDPAFGIAPSTIKYRKSECVQ